MELGSVLVGMKALDKNDKTKIIIIDKLPINSAFLANRPTKAKIHEMAHPMKTASNRASKIDEKPTAGRHPIKKAVVSDAIPERKSRKMSPTNWPAKGTIGEIGKVLNRSKIPELMSSRNCCQDPEAAFNTL